MTSLPLSLPVRVDAVIFLSNDKPLGPDEGGEGENAPSYVLRA